MADDPQAQDKPESADTPKEPMPSSKQTPPEKAEAGPQGEGQAEAAKEAVEGEGTLPKGVKERTANEFEKLRQELRAEKERRARVERMMQSINRTPLPQQQPFQPDYYDPETGEVDVNRLEGRIGGAEAQARQALQTAQRIIDSEDKKQEKAAYKAHPQLDPNTDSFNEDFQRAVIGYLASEYREGKATTLKQAADRVKSFSKADLKKAEEAGAVQARESLTPKEQATMEATGRSDRRSQTGTELETLRQQTRRGDARAIQERLKNIPIVGR